MSYSAQERFKYEYSTAPKPYTLILANELLLSADLIQCLVFSVSQQKAVFSFKLEESSESSGQPCDKGGHITVDQCVQDISQCCSVMISLYLLKIFPAKHFHW